MVLVRSILTVGAATQALSQKAGSFEQVGSTLVSGMMVRSCVAQAQ
jgi:hypothetical protein